MNHRHCSSPNTGRITVVLKEYPSSCHCSPPHSPAAPTQREADKLAEARLISLQGDVTGSVLFDGSSDVEIVADIPALTIEELEEMLK